MQDKKGHIAQGVANKDEVWSCEIFLVALCGDIMAVINKLFTQLSLRIIIYIRSRYTVDCKRHRVNEVKNESNICVFVSILTNFIGVKELRFLKRALGMPFRY